MKWLASLPVLILMQYSSYAQSDIYKQPASVGVHFIFNDFITPSAIRSSSLSSVIRDDKFSNLSDMSQGLAITYGRGLNNHFDFYGGLCGSFLSYPLKNQPNRDREALLIEADASLRGKMFTDKSRFVPYLQAGAGVSKYKGYFGAFIPLGAGLQFNFFGEAYLQINTQYRVAVTESVSAHFVHSIGLVANVGKKEND